MMWFSTSFLPIRLIHTFKRNIMTHIYTIELRFTGHNLDPSEISARLKLEPSNSFSQSQSNSTTKKRCPYWAFNGQGEVGFQSEWESLESALEFLLRSLDSRKAEIISLSSEFDGVWWCGHFQSSFNGGPMLSPKLLIEMGSYGIPMSIDNYFSEE